MLSSISVQAQAAIIAGAVSLVVFIGGEWIKGKVRKKDKRDEVRKIFKSYADPLASAGAALMWRLKEVFDPSGNGFYLEGKRHDTKFEHYKALSTLYRLACVLAWIQAMRRELVFVHGNRPKRILLIEGSLDEFATSLSEGGHVERTRVESLSKLWDIDLSRTTTASLDSVGIRVDYMLKRKLHEQAVASVEELDEASSVELRNEVAVAISKGLAVEQVDSAVLSETHARALQYLSIKEAWIYRDWQAAIGDVMLRPATGKARSYDVIGYGEFEEICTAGEGENCKWLRRLYSVIDDLNPLGDARRDARIRQLREVWFCSAELLKSLCNAERKYISLSPKTLKEIDKTIYLRALK